MAPKTDAGSSWVKLTPRRAMNSKLRKAGFAARGLDEAAICQVADDMSDGFISEDTVEMLALAHHEKQWRKLVAALVREGRWSETDGGWHVHDYLDFNPTKAEWESLMESRRKAGSKGGQAKGRPPDEASAQARATGFGEANGKADGQSQALATAVAKPQAVLGSVSALEKQQQGFTETQEGPADKPAAAASETWNPKAKVQRALTIIAQRQVDGKLSRGEDVPNPPGYIVNAVRGLRTDLAEAIGTLDVDAFPSPEALAEWLRPTPKPVTPKYDPIVETQLARQAKDARNSAPQCPTCDCRGGDGQYLDDDLIAQPCPDCATEVRA